MNAIVYITALALSEAAEKELSGRQKAIFARWKLPSALALPPVLPLFSAAVPPAAGLLRRIRALPWKTSAFSGYGRKGPILYAAADFGGVPPEILRAAEAAGADAGFLPPFPSGFYLADAGEAEADLSEIPSPPAGKIRRLRLQLIEVEPREEKAPWWYAVEWTVKSEEWIKLEG